jgi:hypothetical protein
MILEKSKKCASSLAELLSLATSHLRYKPNLQKETVEMLNNVRYDTGDEYS